MVLDEPKVSDEVKRINDIQVSFEKMALTFSDNLTLDIQNDQFKLVNCLVVVKSIIDGNGKARTKLLCVFFHFIVFYHSKTCFVNV
ncbi:hypothetical protein KHA80_21530 [Anaerobacillus sp. HL2]|nr:hypothetical protein KHA80_21530 [Anaerobacillus sp. HL2]